ncbi:MAG: phytanoyl-CoA dioxygenase family protein [Proteobacteria bacterium]|nr:phytanoyl-CoA dioxygenase family protein [Pseudomonadota bacterium]
MSVAYDLRPSLAADKTAELLDTGYCVIENVIARAKVDALEAELKERFEKTPFADGDFYGRRTKRFGGLLKRAPSSADFVLNKTVMEVVQNVLGPNCDSLQLNIAQGLEIWPGEGEQTPHRDEDMWRCGKNRFECLINVMWPISPFTKENGTTVVWPYSNRCPEDYYLEREQAVQMEMEPGSCLMFLGSTLHGAGANRSALPRTGIVVSYTLGWLKPYENQWLVYPPDVARNFSPELAALVGYQLHRPNVGNYEGQCPSILLKGPVPDYLAAKDGLLPSQIDEVIAFKARQKPQ